MAIQGDIVECNCGNLQPVERGSRVAYHQIPGRLPGSMKACPGSGIEVGHWPAVSRCLGCGATNMVRETVSGSPPYGCAACGQLGELSDFIDPSKFQVKRKVEAPRPAKAPVRHRYTAAAGGERSAPRSPPRCPACEGTRIGQAKPGSRYPYACLDCGMAGALSDFVAAKVAPAPEPPRPEPPPAPLPPPRQEAPRRAAERNVREDLEADFLGSRLAVDDFDDVFDLAEAYAKKAALAGLPEKRPDMLRTFHRYGDKLAEKVSVRGSEAASDLAYLAYFALLEQIARRADVPFRREDLAERVA